MIKLRTKRAKGSGPRRAVPNYGTRRAKFRLMAVVFSLMFVFVLIGEALKPANWQWMSGTALPPPVPAEEDIDTRMGVATTKQRQLPPGVFVIESEADTMDESAGESKLGLNLARYNAIKDNTVFRSAEADVWFDILAALRDQTHEDIRRWNPPRASFTQLYRQPDQYRGRLVAVEGTVRSAEYHPARMKNEHGIPGYWQFFLWPQGSRNPIVVYSLDIPESFPTGDEVNEYAHLAGVFFKRWAYDAKGGIMTAPVLLSKNIEWTPKAIVAPTPLPSPRTITISIAAMGLLGIAIATSVYRNNRHSLDDVDAYRSQTDEAQLAISRLTELDLPSEETLVHDALARHVSGLADEDTDV